MDAGIDQHFLELQSAGTGQSHVKHDAAGCVGAGSFKKFLRRFECHHAQTHRLKKILDALARGSIIINDKYDGLLDAHIASPIHYSEAE
jgi:hypothetical protein